jgi:hypothetical protein
MPSLRPKHPGHRQAAASEGPDKGTVVGSQIDRTVGQPWTHAGGKRGPRQATLGRAVELLGRALPAMLQRRAHLDKLPAVGLSQNLADGPPLVVDGLGHEPQQASRGNHDHRQ